MLRRLVKSAIKRVPGGKAFLKRREIYQRLFQPGQKKIYQGIHKAKKGADQIFLSAFDRIFLLLSAFYLNGLRGDIYEFGVMYGYSARILTDCMNRFGLEQARLHLLDSFEGLPEGTQHDLNSYEYLNGAWQKGVLSVPEGLDSVLLHELEKKLGKGRVLTVKGFFEDTLEEHLINSQAKKALLVNLDCDLYSSSKYVLRTLIEHNILQDGTLLICDDWMTSFGNPNIGQRKAVKEILDVYSNWSIECLFNYGLGSHVFVVHDLSIEKGFKLHENPSSCSLPA